MRDCALLKHFLLWIGTDQFDDFELIMLVHEAMFEKEGKTTTYVQVTAGAHSVKTESSPTSVFQQPLHIIVEQGVEEVVADLMDSRHNVMATLRLNVVEQILNPKTLVPEVVYFMKQRSKGVLQPKIQLTMVVNNPDDIEASLVDGRLSSDVDLLVRQQLRKAKQQHGEEETSEMDVLKDACTGPLEIFQVMGRSTEVYAAVIGPPISRRWVLGIWRDQEAFEKKKEEPVQEVDLTKIQSIQADPHRNHVFVVNYFDDLRNRYVMTFRRVDRARDVWVEILNLMVTKAREATKHLKIRKNTQQGGERGGSRSGGHSANRGAQSENLPGLRSGAFGASSSSSRNNTVR